MEVESHVTEVTPEVASLKLPLWWQLFVGVAPPPPLWIWLPQWRLEGGTLQDRESTSDLSREPEARQPEHRQ